MQGFHFKRWNVWNIKFFKESPIFCCFLFNFYPQNGENSKYQPENTRFCHYMRYLSKIYQAQLNPGSGRKWHLLNLLLFLRWVIPIRRPCVHLATNIFKVKNDPIFVVSLQVYLHIMVVVTQTKPQRVIFLYKQDIFEKYQVSPKTFWHTFSHTNILTYILTYEHYDIHSYIYTLWHTFLHMNIMTYILTYEYYDIHSHILTLWHTFSHMNMYILTYEHSDIQSPVWILWQTFLHMNILTYILTYEHYAIHSHIWTLWHTFSHMNIMTYLLIYESCDMHAHIWIIWHNILTYARSDIHSNVWTLWHTYEHSNIHSNRWISWHSHT